MVEHLVLFCVKFLHVCFVLVFSTDKRQSHNLLEDICILWGTFLLFYVQSLLTFTFSGIDV